MTRWPVTRLLDMNHQRAVFDVIDAEHDDVKRVFRNEWGGAVGDLYITASPFGFGED